MKYLLMVSILTFGYSQAFNVENIQASQRTDGSQIVDVCYDLTEDDIFISFRIVPELSIDGGDTWMGLNIPNQANIIGDNVLPGSNKCFEINLTNYLTNTYTSSAKVRVTAEGHEAINLPFEMVAVQAGEYMGEEYIPGYGFGIDTVKTIDYNYEIMKYEVTNAQYLQFLLEALENGYLNNSSWGSASNSEGLCFEYPGETFLDFFDDDIASHESDPDQHGRCDDLFKYYDTPLNAYASKIYWNGTTFVISEGYGNHPITYVSYTGAWAFANYYGLRIPNKDEWLKAARGMNPWDTAYGPETGYDNPKNRANLYDSDDPFESNEYTLRSTPVGFYNGQENNWGYETIDSPSPYGTYDQTGNAQEWTTTAANTPDLFLKGGSFENWYHGTITLNNSHSAESPTAAGNAFGFRCVRTVNIAD